MDETEYPEDGETEGGALSAASPFETREQYLGAYNKALEGQQQAVRAEAEARRQAYERGQRYIQQNSFGQPTQSEQLLRISQALLSPRRSRSFGATLANVVPAFAQNQQLSRQAEEQRAAALQQLQQQYLTGNATATREAAGERVSGLARLSPLYNTPRPRQTWSENLGRFVSPDIVEVVRSGTTSDGRRTEQLSDGTLRVYNTDGTRALYDAGGNPISEGAQ